MLQHSSWSQMRSLMRETRSTWCRGGPWHVGSSGRSLLGITTSWAFLLFGCGPPSYHSGDTVLHLVSRNGHQCMGAEFVLPATVAHGLRGGWGGGRVVLSGAVAPPPAPRKDRPPRRTGANPHAYWRGVEAYSPHNRGRCEADNYIENRRAPCGSEIGGRATRQPAHTT
jgi:hypothetical protein